MNLKKLKTKLMKFVKGSLATLMIAGSITLPASTLSVNAAASFTDDDFYNGLSELTSVSASTLKDPNFWSDYKYLSYPIYGTGTADLHVITKGSFETLKSGMLDCMRFAYAATGHAMYKAGLEPTDYIGINGWGIFAPSQKTNYLKGFTETTDISIAEPGDLIEYGPNSHLAVVLGWKDGALWQIQGSSTGSGPVITKYTGYNYTPSGYNTPFYRLYHFPHALPTKTITANVIKTSSNADITDGNASYSLSGAKFEVYAGSSASGQPLTTITTDASGNGSETGLIVSNTVTNITFKEVSAPTGYLLNNTVQTVNIASDNTVTAHFSDDPNLHDIAVTLQKTSGNTAITSNNSAYSLSGARYSISYMNQYGNFVYLGDVVTDANGFASGIYTGLPLGITKIRAIEVEAPKGYELNSSPVDTVLQGNSASFNIVEQPQLQNITVSINKSSRNPSLTNGNSCYSLGGAVYEVSYLNSNGQYSSLGNLTTDTNGQVSNVYTNLPLGITKIKIKETTAPKGYYLDNSEYTESVANARAVFNVSDIPGNDPVVITLEKQTEDPVDNPASLEGAEFTVKYYAVDPSLSYTSAQLGSLNAARTWVIATKYNTVYGMYYTTLHDDFKVSGDDFYRDLSGMATLPIGVVTVQETKAPPGYTLDNVITYQLNNQTNEYEQTDGVAIFKIMMDSETSASVVTKNNYLYTEGVSRGGIKIQKRDTQTDLTLQGDTTNRSTMYRIRNLNDFEVAMKVNGTVVAKAKSGEQFDYDIVTDTNGCWESPKNNSKYEFLQSGTVDNPAKYRIEEVQAPDGFVIESADNPSLYASYDFELTDNQQLVDLTSVLGDDIIRGGFKVQKNDNDLKSGHSQGDTDLMTVFKLINRSLHPVVVSGKTYANGQVIELFGDGNKYFTTDANGLFVSSDQLLPYGTYEIVEVQAPTGYKLEGGLNTVFSIRNDHQIVDITASFYDNVVTGTFSIYKHYNKQNNSEWDDKPEQGAVFLGILTSKLNSVFNGDVFDAYNRITSIIGDDMIADGDILTSGTESNILYNTYGISPKEFSIVKTGADGKAYSTPLAYGTYSIHQIKGDVNTIIMDDSATFKVNGIDSSYSDPDGMSVAIKTDQSLIEYSATNDYKTFLLTINKKDAATGKNVSLNGASFKIGYDHDGDGIWTQADRNYSEVFSDYNRIENGYVVQTVYGIDYDVFRTYSTNNNDETADRVFVINTDTEDKKGSVTTPVKVRAGRYFIFESDNDDSTVKETPWGYVTADPDDYQIDGSLYNKSDNNAEYPVAGEIQVSDTHYAIMYDANTETIFTDDLYTAITSIANSRVLGELNVNKFVESFSADTSLVDRNDLSGFRFELTADEDIIDPADGSIITKSGDVAKTVVNGTYVESGRFYTNSDGTYQLNNIPLGSYTLRETGQPNGTVTNRQEYKVVFAQDENDRSTLTITKSVDIENKTTKVSIEKMSVSDTMNNLPDAELSIYDENGILIDSWITSDSSHVIEGLTAGKVYTLSEITSPDGYVKATPISFTVKDTSDTQIVRMTDKQIFVDKLDSSNNHVTGAEMTVFDESGNPVDTWITDGTVHAVSGLDENKSYTICETDTPSGFVKAADVAFTVSGADDSGVKTNQSYTIVDKKVIFSKQDVDSHFVKGAVLEVYELLEDGSFLTDQNDDIVVVDKWTSGTNAYNISNLISGHRYLVREVSAPDGYVQATDITFTVEDDINDQTINMIDLIVEVFKHDVSIRAVSGAVMQIIDENGTVVDEWVSSNLTHKANGLKAGGVYTLHEVKAPDGYVRAADVTFTVEDDGLNKYNNMLDKQLSVIKSDPYGRKISGAVMSVTDMMGNVVDQWTTDDTGEHFVNNLDVGMTYTLNEDVSPDGYVKATPITFVVEDNRQDQSITMYDKQVFVSKVDVAGIPLSGAEMTVFDESGNPVDTWITDGTIHAVSGLDENKSYTICETDTPSGFVKAADVAFTVSGADDSGIKMNQDYTVVDKKVIFGKHDANSHFVNDAVLEVYELLEDGSFLTDQNGDNIVVDTWVTNDSDYLISNLEVGKKYMISEIVVPDGYVKASDIVFDVTDDESDQTVIMTDMIVEIFKHNVSIRAVSGAVMQIIDENGTVVDEWVSSNLTHKANGLKAGGVYTLHEVKAPDGYVRAADVTFTVEDDGLNKYNNMLDKQLSVIKSDPYGRKISGAVMSVTDMMGNVVDQWTTDDTGEHFVNNLDVGMTYTLNEDVSPDGYVKATPISFTVTDDRNNQIVTMFDKQVFVSKYDADDIPLSGAEMTVFDESGNPIDTWITDGTVHAVSGLDENKSYTICETDTPSGFVKAADVAFTVSGADDSGIKMNQDYTVVDKKVSLNKTDGLGNEVTGALVQVLDLDGNVVDEWISGSDPHDVNNLIVGNTYVWHEEYAEETEGYYYFEDSQFKVAEDGLNATFEMIDHPIRYEISKVNSDGDLIEGVRLKLYDVTDENNPVEVELPNDGVTTNEPILLEKVLIAEHKYKLEEFEYKEGLYQADAVLFQVPKYGTYDITRVQMVDAETAVSVEKNDNHGNPVSGAKLSVLKAEKNENGEIVPVYDEDGNEIVVHEWITNHESHDISEYVMGSNNLSGEVWYILRETETPMGFIAADDISFTVTGSGENHQTIVMTDVRKTYYVSAIKADANNHKKYLKGAEITLYTKDDQIAKDVNGNDCVGLTDGKGAIIWEVEYNGDISGYYVKETKAPKGYLINNDKHSVELSEDYDFAKNNVVKILVRDTLAPVVNTSDLSNIAGWTGLFICSFVLALFALKNRHNQ